MRTLDRNTRIRCNRPPGPEIYVIRYAICSAVVSYSMMTTTTTGLLRGATIKLESAVPEMDGQRVHVMLEPVEEERLSAQQQREFWRVWVERGPEGPIEDGIDTDIP